MDEPAASAEAAVRFASGVASNSEPFSGCCVCLSSFVCATNRQELAQKQRTDGSCKANLFLFVRRRLRALHASKELAARVAAATAAMNARREQKRRSG